MMTPNEGGWDKIIHSSIIYCEFAANGTALFDLWSPVAVRDIVIHPPTAFFTAGSGVPHIISTSLFGGAVHILSRPSAVGQMGSNAFDFRHRFGEPTEIHGTHELNLIDMSTGEPSSVTGFLAIPIELIGYVPSQMPFDQQGAKA